MKYLMLLLMLALTSCEQSPTALEPTSSPTVPYQAFPIASDGFRLIPGGQTMWDTAFYAEIIDERWFHRPYDTTREVAVKIDSLYVDTGWGVASNPSYSQTSTVFDVIIAANEKSKRYGLDTVYTYTGKDSDTLVGLSTRSVNGYRIPTPKEVKYLLWAGSISKRPWGSGNVNSSWASEHLFGDSATGIKNDFGVYVYFATTSSPGVIVSGHAIEGEGIVCWVYPPIDGFDKAYVNRALDPKKWGIGRAPLIFVRSIR